MRESTTLIVNEERSRRRSGGKRKLVNKESVLHKSTDLMWIFLSYDIKIFLFSKKRST